MSVDLWSSFSAYCLMMLYICIKFHENILKGVRVIEGLLFLFSGFSTGHNSVKNVGGVTVLDLFISSDHALKKVKVSHSLIAVGAVGVRVPLYLGHS